MASGVGDEVECVKEFRSILNRTHVDIQLLGIGEDGHIAFNEPGQAFRLSGILFYQAFEDPGFSFLWSSVVMLTMTALCAKGFLGRLRKEQGL